MSKIAMLGLGAWGSALAHVARASNHEVIGWSRSGDISLADAIATADIIVSAISMKGVPHVAAQVAALPRQAHAVLVTATKGLDPATLRTPSQIWQAMLPEHPVVVLSGPNLSKEIMQGLPAATVVAAVDEAVAATVQRAYSCDRMRVYTNTDPLGTELGGTLKNVIAIAVGVCDGLNLGTNAKAALVTRGLTEIIRVGTHLGAQAETFAGLSGLGDLLATCNSPLSRNYRVGYGLGQGKTLDALLEELEGTAEGVNTASVLVELADKEGIPVPISRYVNRLLIGKITAIQAVEGLMERDLKPEFCDV